jgi:hypothetical protein
MTANQYTFYNGALPTTAKFVPVTTGTGLKTLLQVATPSTLELQVVSWGISFDGATFGTKVQCELLETDVAATVTTGSGHITKTTGPAQVGSQVTVGTTSTGYTASAEGTIAATRLFDVQNIDGTAGYSYTWPLGNYPVVSVSKFLRIRVQTGTAVNAICYVTWTE